jgi:ATP-binding cassette subfamily B protein
MQVLMSLMTVSMLVTRISRAEASAVRLQEVLATVPKVQAPAVLVEEAPPSRQGRIVFEHVTFRYEGAGDRSELGEEKERNAVLRDISFTVEPGQTVALLGATGSGKSTLAHLIPRFYDVGSGRITIDGVDVRELEPQVLRRVVSVAMQEAVLFHGTIRDNIAYGRPDATDTEVLAAARLAQAHNFIMELPGGYNALIEQRGVNLSGGQKQRLAIARALLVDPPVLLLDDSTSAVDVATEARIRQGLADTRRGRTNLLVAQRISSVLGADLILVLEDGAIVASGTHTQLLASSSIYQDIYRSQLEKGTVQHD